jgi:hypothetical protein
MDSLEPFDRDPTAQILQVTVARCAAGERTRLSSIKDYMIC